MESILKVGIDIGSTTIKIVVLDKEKKILYKNYARHFSEIGEALHENLSALKHIVGEKSFFFALTGSAGMGIAQRIGLPFVQEVIACASAVKAIIPATDTVVELGGEDAKITYFGDAPEQRMNGVCAGGTGSFIDHMASLLSTDALGLNALAEKGKQIYTIASRCGVFAKTDIQALMNDGAEKADIALSILQAVVNQTISNLAQGRPITCPPTPTSPRARWHATRPPISSRWSNAMGLRGTKRRWANCSAMVRRGRSSTCCWRNARANR